MAAATEREQRKRNRSKDLAREGEVLFPERELEIGGETITVKEFTFSEAMKLERKAKPIIKALAEFGDRWDTLDYLEVAEVFSDHAEEFVELLSSAIGKPAKWIENLSDKDGSSLAITFWTVNSDFFVRRLMAAIVQKTMRKIAAE